MNTKSAFAMYFVPQREAYPACDRRRLLCPTKTLPGKLPFDLNGVYFVPTSADVDETGAGGFLPIARNHDALISALGSYRPRTTALLRTRMVNMIAHQPVGVGE